MNLNEAVDRFALLNDEHVDVERMDLFYAKCAQLPIIYLEEALKRHKSESRHLEVNVIPEMMFAEQRRSIETLDGTKIEIRGEINASLKGADLQSLSTWLDERGYGSIVKKKHYLADDEVTPDQIEALEKEGIELHADLDLNTATFKKAVKEIYEATDELPPENMATVSIFNHAVIKQRKDN